tara:strand:- start:3543 stop:3881 length:339 start_codon:yes stop_codon:yes gene_type:complete
VTVSKNKSKKNLKKIKQYYFIIEFIAVTVITFLIIFLLETFNKPKFNSNDLLPGLENSFYPIIAWLLYIVILVIRIAFITLLLSTNNSRAKSHYPSIFFILILFFLLMTVLF